MKKWVKYLLVGSGIFIKTFCYVPQAHCPTMENSREEIIEYNTTIFKNYKTQEGLCAKLDFGSSSLLE